MDSIVSVIIPVYNVEKYLWKCIESIQKQTYKKLEIILVDDGSSDKSPSICDRYSEKDSRITVIHNKNKGVSSARNMGIEVSRGEFICFVDADDWLPKYSIEKLVNCITESTADLCQGGRRAITFYPKVKRDSVKKSIVNCRSCKSLAEWINYKMTGEVWGKLYKRSIIEENHLCFGTAKMFEDTIFLLKYIKYCSKVVSTDEILYFQNKLVLNSAVTKYYPELGNWTMEWLEAYIGLFNSSNDMPPYDEIRVHISGAIGRTYEHFIMNCSQEIALQKMAELKKELKVFSEEWDMPAKKSMEYLYDEILALDPLVVYNKMYDCNTKKKYLIKMRIKSFFAPIVEFFVYKVPVLYR